MEVIVVLVYSLSLLEIIRIINMRCQIGVLMHTDACILSLVLVFQIVAIESIEL